MYVCGVQVTAASQVAAVEKEAARPALRSRVLADGVAACKASEETLASAGLEHGKCEALAAEAMRMKDQAARRIALQPAWPRVGFCQADQELVEALPAMEKAPAAGPFASRLMSSHRPRRPWTAWTRPWAQGGHDSRARTWVVFRGQTSIQELKALGKPPRECVDVVAACGFLLRQACMGSTSQALSGLTSPHGLQKSRGREREREDCNTGLTVP